MKLPTSQIILLLLAAHALLAQSTARAENPAASQELPVSGWGVIGDKTQVFGPKMESEEITFSGTGFGEKGKYEAAYFPKTALATGESLEFSAKVTFNGVSAAGNFRFGIYQKRSKDHSRGWLGYTAYTGIEKRFPKGGLFASEVGNDNNYDAATDRVLGESTVPIKNVKDGTYLLTMKLTNSGNGIACEASMHLDDNPNALLASYSAVDSDPATMTFDAIGFSTHEVLSVDSISFAEVSLKHVAD